MKNIKSQEIFELCRLAAMAKEGHIGSSLSILNILNAIYFMKEKNTIEFILSKGHASLALYIILKKYEYINSDQLSSFCKVDSSFGGHPDYTKVPGIFGSTGSLGHGLPQAVGKALALKAKKSKNNVVVLIGDGEINEGSNWEAFLLGVHHNLDNLTCIVDFNGSSERAVSVTRVPNALHSLGWDVKEVNGHSEADIIKAYSSRLKRFPTVIWANTTKGKGISFMENNPEWHHKFPSFFELDMIAKELKVEKTVY